MSGFPPLFFVHQLASLQVIAFRLLPLKKSLKPRHTLYFNNTYTEEQKRKPAISVRISALAQNDHVCAGGRSRLKKSCESIYVRV